MESTLHTLQDLFLQLGLPAEQDDIDDFIGAHRPLPEAVLLADAPFWTESQAKFLRDEIKQDADWAEVVDQLNLALRA